MTNEPTGTSGHLQLRLVHGAMVMGVLIFAGVVRWFLQPEPLPAMPMWVWAPLAFAVPAFFVAGIVRGRLAPNAEWEKRQTHAVIVWALGEGVALMGLVAILVTGYWYPAGLATIIGLGLMLFHHPGTFLEARSGPGRHSGPRHSGPGRRSGSGKRA